MSKKIVVIGTIGPDAITLEVDPAVEIAKFMGWPLPGGKS